MQTNNCPIVSPAEQPGSLAAQLQCRFYIIGLSGYWAIVSSDALFQNLALRKAANSSLTSYLLMKPMFL